MELGVGLVRVCRKGSPPVPGSPMEVPFDVWIYGIEVFSKFVDLIFPGCTVNIINISKPPLD